MAKLLQIKEENEILRNIRLGKNLEMAYEEYRKITNKVSMSKNEASIIELENKRK